MSDCRTNIPTQYAGLLGPDYQALLCPLIKNYTDFGGRSNRTAVRHLPCKRPTQYAPQFESQHPI